jgi:hypothetical protein
MRPVSATFVSTSLAALLMASLALPASAACTRLGFSVNDYGKDGPTKDAKGLLDKYIAKWATEHNISKYRTGTKDVKCELFLNFIVFDEHTCRAEATVCWDGAPVTAPQSAGLAPSDKPEKPAAAPIKRAAVTKPAKPDADKIETGAVSVPKPSSVPAPAAAVVAPPTVPKPATVQPAAADQAAIAAQKAADAAERAAAAAERAAAAASAAEKSSNVIAVPPPAAAAAAAKP